MGGSKKRVDAQFSLFLRHACRYSLSLRVSATCFSRSNKHNKKKRKAWERGYISCTMECANEYVWDGMVAQHMHRLMAPPHAGVK